MADLDFDIRADVYTTTNYEQQAEEEELETADKPLSPAKVS